MSQPAAESQPRVLIVDDNPAIHEDFRKILGTKTEAQSRLEDVEATLFGPSSSSLERVGFRIDSAYQGQEALALVEQAVQAGDPYVVAFVDVRMPPGWDGIETLERIWQSAPELQAVICTAYSDYSWDDMTRRLGQADNLLILKKPFETIEVLQLAHALTQKWTLARQAKLRMEDLDKMVRQRTEELVDANQQLQEEIEERTRIQDRLAASEERFSKAFHDSPNPMAILNGVDRRFLDANHSFLELCGYAPEELMQQSDKELGLWSAGQRPDKARFVPDGRLRNESCVIHRRDGSTRQILMSAEPLSLGTTPCLLLNVEDVTEQLKLEAQLRQAQKMEVVGRMAAGIAHEFNNVLTVIQGDVGLLQSVNAGAVDTHSLLNQIMQASQRAAAFTKQLLAFSRKQVLQPRQINVSTVVQRMRRMLSGLIGEKFQIEMNCPDSMPEVLADEGGLEQILLNLVLNARDAMPDGGNVGIAVEPVTLDKAAAALNPEARSGQFVRLSVTDHGCGMTPQVLARIFDPFFTTKDIGKGTGLGLSTIHGIVKQHEGWVDVSSEVGQGSQFRVFLPVWKAAPSSSQQGTDFSRRPMPVPSGKGETILVVEDENAVRELAFAALKKRGYHVLKAANGPEAIAVWERCSTPIDLLLTDMVMPNGMSGGDLARTLQTRSPHLNVIYTSGYSPEILSQDSLLAQGINFLPKPYDLQTLCQAVRLCLDGGKLPPCEVRPGQAEEAAVNR